MVIRVNYSQKSIINDQLAIFDQNEKLEFEIIKKVKLLQRNVRLWLERRRLGVIGNNDEKRHKGIVSQYTLVLYTTFMT